MTRSVVSLQVLSCTSPPVPSSKSSKSILLVYFYSCQLTLGTIVSSQGELSFLPILSKIGGVKPRGQLFAQPATRPTPRVFSLHARWSRFSRPAHEDADRRGCSCTRRDIGDEPSLTRFHFCRGYVCRRLRLV